MHVVLGRVDADVQTRMAPGLHSHAERPGCAWRAEWLGLNQETPNGQSLVRGNVEETSAMRWLGERDRDVVLAVNHRR